MPDFPKLPIINPPPRQSFPELPILEPDPPRMTLREKYGGLYYLGIGGLILSVYLVGSFVVGFYQSRHLWAAILVLHNPSLSDATRYEAAWQVAHDPHANDAQRMNMALSTDLPNLARYIVAEGLTSDSIRTDPKAYALMAARSEAWPDWLRLMVARPMAYAVGEGYRIAWEPLDELRTRSDKAIVLWMTYTRAVMGPGDEAAARELKDATAKPGPYQDLAKLLEAAAEAEGTARTAQLDEATAWLRRNHPPCALVWDQWEVRNGALALRVNGPKLVAPPASVPTPTPTPSDKATPPR